MPPRSAGDVAKIGAWLLLRVFMSGTVGGQHILYVVKNGAEGVSPPTGGE
jgi:hypothetical protein